ncbi:MAG: phosphate acyltransferase PlsX [Candidatus Bipolaricaulota bacterium]
MRILLDVMGGDRPPGELIAGGVAAGRRHGIEMVFAGDELVVRRALDRIGVSPRDTAFSILHAPDVVRMDDAPVRAAREKRDSSLLRGLGALAEAKVDAFVSPGNTGAVVAGSLFTLGRVAAIPRPGILVALPTLEGRDLLVIDVGANADCSAEHLESFALMGVTYARSVLGIAQPSVGLLNIGEEDTKGNRLTIEAFRALRERPLDFRGNVEPHDLLTERPVDVVVCDGFVGNVLLKSVEGGVAAVTTLLKRAVVRNLITKLGAFLLQHSFRTLRATLSYSRRGGAPLLGVNGVVVIAHGRSDAEAIGSAIDVAVREVRGDVVARLARGFEGWAADGI